MISRKKIYIKGMDVRQNKNRHIHSLIAPFAVGLLLCACGSDNVAGGGPSGTEAGNAITAQIFIADAPAANARVKLVEEASLDGNGYIATANENGIVTIENVAVGKYIMEASLDESAIQTPVTVQNLNDTVELGMQALQKAVYIGGNVSDFITDSTSENYKNTTGFIKFRGLDHSAFVTNGKFEVFGLPAGKLEMVILPNAKHDTVNVSIKAKAGDSLTTLKPKTQPPQDTSKKDTAQKNSTLLIDDFEDGDNIHLLASEIPYFNYSMGNWNLTTATLSQAMSPFSPSIPDSEKIAVYPEWPADFNGHPFKLVIQDSKEGGKEVHATFDFPDTASYPLYAVITMSIGNYGYSYDLSSVDSIAFDAWGSGETEIQITSNPHYMSKTSGTLPVTLPKNKTKLKYAWADLVPSEEDRKSVTTITFAFHDDAEIHLDNVEFIGKDLMNIWKK